MLKTVFYIRDLLGLMAQVCVCLICLKHEHYYNFSGYLNRFAMPLPASGTDEEMSSTHFDSDWEPSVDHHVLVELGVPLATATSNLWNSYDHGGVHFLGFSTEHNLSLQVDFIREDLKAAAANRHNVPWIVAYGHRPVYW